MRDRLPLILSATALLVSVLGATPLGSAAYNAVVPANSVGALQLRNGAVTKAKLRGDAVTSGKVLNHSLKAIDFAAGQLPAGPQGPKGDKGDKGAKGDKGDKGPKGDPGATTVVVRRLLIDKAATSAGTTSFLAYDVPCQAGEQAIAGGAGLANGGVTSDVTLATSIPVAPDTDAARPTGWKAGLWITNQSALKFAFYVVCAKP